MTEQLERISEDEYYRWLHRQVAADKHKTWLPLLNTAERRKEAQLQADKIVMDNMKWAMKKELEDKLFTSFDGIITRFKTTDLQAFWQKWLGEDK